MQKRPDKQNRRQQIGISCALLILLALFPGWLTWRQLQGASRQRALFDAIRSNNAAKVIALLDAGADPNRREQPATFQGVMDNLFRTSSIREKETTPLRAALYHVDNRVPGKTMIQFNPNPNPAIVRALLERGADANAADETMSSSIEFAVLSSQIEVVDLLLKHGAQVNQSGMMGTLLMSASMQGRVEMMRYLLEHGADINAKNSQGQNALTLTVRFARKPDAVQLLLDRHIDLHVKDRQGKTALFYAQTPFAGLAPTQTRHLPEVIALLKKAGAK